MVVLLGRYKQRAEWFPSEELEKATAERGERDLKRDFLRYLFDSGIDFSVEAEVPPGGGEADVLPVLRDKGPLPIEAKVHDGATRGASYVSRGLSQAAEYGHKFNARNVYYLVYNVAENTVLDMPGTATGSHVYRTDTGGVVIHSAVANLRNTLPASKASELKHIAIGFPGSSG
jgi:hypothetical protein